jgi:hypothetical protein
VESVIEKRSEPRINMMAQVEARWEDDAGVSHSCRGKLEDISTKGLGIRITEPIAVGSKLVVGWRQESIAGTVVQCRQVGQNHFLGIKRDTAGKPDGN